MSASRALSSGGIKVELNDLLNVFMKKKNVVGQGYYSGDYFPELVSSWTAWILHNLSFALWIPIIIFYEHVKALL